MQELVRKYFEESVETTRRALVLADDVASVGTLMVDTLKRGQRLLVCGNGGSAADAQHFAAEFIGRFETERVALPCIALTTDTSILTAWSNDYSYDTVFARQVSALGSPGDLLLGISTSGNSESVVRAFTEGQAKGMSLVALLGRDGGRIGKIDGVRSIVAPATRTSLIQQIHIMVLHAWARMVDEAYRS